MAVRTACHLLVVPLAPAQTADPLSPIPNGPAGIETRLAAGNLASPVYLADATDGTGRLFIVEQTGLIQIV